MSSSTSFRPALTGSVGEPAATTTPTALAVRRLFLVACPVLAGLFVVLGALADPASGIAGRRMTEIYIANPDPLQWKSTGYHWGYAFWIAPTLLVVGHVRGRGAWLANLGALVGFAGLVTLPGLLMSDWYASAIGQLYGVQGTVKVEDLMRDTMWGPAGFVVAGIGGFLLSLPLTAAALWRAQVVRWWGFAAVVAAHAAFFVSTATWWGGVLTAACLAVFAVALERGTRSRSSLS